MLDTRTLRSGAGTALCACLLTATAAFAATPDHGESTPLHLPSAEPTKAASQVSSGGTLVRTIVGLAVVLGVIYGIAWVLRQVRTSREERSSGPGLRSVATLALGPNRAVHLVRVGEDLVLVGSGEKGVTALRTYSAAEAAAAGLGGFDPPADGPGPSGGAAMARPSLRAMVDELRQRTVRR